MAHCLALNNRSCNLYLMFRQAASTDWWFLCYIYKYI